MTVKCQDIGMGGGYDQQLTRSQNSKRDVEDASECARDRSNTQIHQRLIGRKLISKDNRQTVRAGFRRMEGFDVRRVGSYELSSGQDSRENKDEEPWQH
jgi:hypothetical protein